jgi:hypothetical protein
MFCDINNQSHKFPTLRKTTIQQSLTVVTITYRFLQLGIAHNRATYISVCIYNIISQEQSKQPASLG